MVESSLAIDRYSGAERGIPSVLGDVTRTVPGSRRALEDQEGSERQAARYARQGPLVHRGGGPGWLDEGRAFTVRIPAGGLLTA